MEVKVLGANNLESTTSWLTTLLIDGVMALDSGSLTSGLSLAEQKNVKAVLLTHRHFDHIRDLPIFGLATAFDSTKEIYGLAYTLDFVRGHLLDGEIYPRMEEYPTPERPSFRLRELDILQEVDILGYRVKPIPVKHGGVHAVGYQIVSKHGKCLFYTGDTGQGLAACWEHTSPDLLAIEVSMPSGLEEQAARTGHLTPGLLRKELLEFKQAKGYLPLVLVLHMSPFQEDEIRAELRQLQLELGVAITPGKRHLKISL